MQNLLLFPLFCKARLRSVCSLNTLVSIISKCFLITTFFKNSCSKVIQIAYVLICCQFFALVARINTFSLTYHTFICIICLINCLYVLLKYIWNDFKISLIILIVTCIMSLNALKISSRMGLVPLLKDDIQFNSTYTIALAVMVLTQPSAQSSWDKVEP